MALYTTLLLKLAPLYMNILLGLIAGKILLTPRDAVAKIMFFLINPLIMFNGILHTRIDSSVLSLPILTLFISSALCLIFYRISSNLWDDSTKNLMAFSAGSGNTGYFGIPLALILFDNQGEGVYMMAILGITLYENSLGFYVFAKGSHSPSECLHKLARLPTLYAFVLALFVNLMHIPMPAVFADFMCHIKGTYTVLGMMIIGLGLSSLHNFQVDLKFVSLSFLAKFLVWPAVILLLVFVDATWLGIYSTDIHNALILLSIVPLAVNSVILASVLQTQPEKAATAVLMSTLFALVYVPLMIIYFISTATNFPNLYQCPVNSL
jgi:malate permease and related proteins